MKELGEFINKIFKGDSIEIMKQIPDKSIDLIFADPPYFMQLENTLMRYEGTEFAGVKDDHWDKFAGFKDYDNFSISWITQCKRILKDNGSLWIIGSFQNIYRIGTILMDLDFWIINDVIWEKSNPVPNFNGVRFTNAHETLLWVVKDKKTKPTFNYKTMKEYNGGKQMRSVWNIPLCTGNERLKRKDGKKLHSTQKPELLLERVILSTSKKDDIVLDPFFGTGTTGAMAKKLSRKYIGIEKEEEYIQAATKRINQVEPISIEKYEKLEIKPPRVSFKMLFEKELVFIGETLYSKDKTQAATLQKNGHVQYADEVLSIHKASAKALNKVNHNGWAYWHVLRDGKLLLIDELRRIYRENFLA